MMLRVLTKAFRGISLRHTSQSPLQVWDEDRVFLVMQYVAGVITESQWRMLVESDPELERTLH